MDSLKTIQTLDADGGLDQGAASSLSYFDSSERHARTKARRGTPSRGATHLSEMAKMLLQATILAESLTTAGASEYSFLVMLPQRVRLDLARLGVGEVTVTGPNGYRQTASLVAVRGRTICYCVKAPHGTWTQADNGIYRIALVVDESASPGLMQAFQVSVENSRCLLQNGSFEAEFTNWVTLAGTERISKANVYIGLASLVLSTMDSGTSQAVQVAPGMILQLTGYGRSTSQGYSSFGMSFFNAKGSLLSRCDVGTIGSSEWTDYFAVAIAPTHTAYVQVWTYQGVDHGLTYINGLSLRQIQPEELPPRRKKHLVLDNQPLTVADNIFSNSVLYSADGTLLKASVKPEVYQWVQECLRYGSASGTDYDR